MKHSFEMTLRDWCETLNHVWLDEAARENYGLVKGPEDFAQAAKQIQASEPDVHLTDNGSDEATILQAFPVMWEMFQAHLRGPDRRRYINWAGERLHILCWGSPYDPQYDGKIMTRLLSSKYHTYIFKPDTAPDDAELDRLAAEAEADDCSLFVCIPNTDEDFNRWAGLLTVIIPLAAGAGDTVH